MLDKDQIGEANLKQIPRMIMCGHGVLAMNYSAGKGRGEGGN